NCRGFSIRQHRSSNSRRSLIMRSNWTKSVLVAAAVATLPVSAFASSARVEGLGLQPDYIQDYVNVTTYPSTIVRYQNLVYGDLGVKDVSGGDLSDFNDNNTNPVLLDAGRSMGAYLGNLWSGRLGVWGVQFNENANPLSPAIGSDRMNRNPNEAFTILWGWKGSSLSLGANLDRSFSSNESSNGTTTITLKPFTTGALPSLSANNTRQFINGFNAILGSRHFNTFGVGGGISYNWEAMGRQHTLDASVHYRTSD